MSRTTVKPKLPETPYYSLVHLSNKTKHVIPCFSMAETALIHLWATASGHEAFAKVRKKILDMGSITRHYEFSPELIRLAAAYAQENKIIRYYTSDPKRSCHEIKATYRKILRPSHEKRTQELRQEIIRKGV